MAQAKNRLGKIDSVVSLVQWAWDRIAVLGASALGGGVMGRLAATTDWISQYGPIAWGLAGLASFILIVFVLSAWAEVSSRSRLRRAQASVVEVSASTVSINPLQAHFLNQRIRLADLIPVAGEPVEGRSFDGCDLIGPITVLALGCHFNEVEWTGASFVEIADELFVRHSANKLVLKDSHVRKCRIYNVVFLVREGEAGAMRKLGGEWLN